LAVSIGDLRLLIEAGIVCRANPALLNEMDVVNSRWQQIWLFSIKNGNRLDEGLNDPVAMIFRLYDSILIDRKFNEELFIIISRSEFANLLHYPSREQLWKKIPSNYLDGFLRKTSASLLETLSKNYRATIPDDKVLTHYTFISIARILRWYFRYSKFMTSCPSSI
jgi:hypothetical protein